MTKKKNTKASEALKRSAEHKGIPNDVRYKGIELFKVFAEVFQDMYPGGRFDVTHVMDWISEYAKLDSTITPPQMFLNSYALGKFLMSNQNELGIQYSGSYGNRATYQVIV